MVDTAGRRGGDQIKEMELKLHPNLNGPLSALCMDPKTTIVVLSGSDRNVLDDVLHLAFLPRPPFSSLLAPQKMPIILNSG